MKAALVPLLPLIITGVTILVDMAAVSIKRNHRIVFYITLSGLLASFAATAVLAGMGPQQAGLLFLFDDFALFCSGLLLAAGFAVVVLSFDYMEGRGRGVEEYYILLLGAMLGALALVGARHFISFFLGLEVLSIALYPLIAYQRAEAFHAEAGIKYLVLSAVSSTFLLFGMAIIYGLTGDMSFPAIGRIAAIASPHQPMMLTAMVFVVIGIGFKLGVVPFHMWTPDVYQGAPAPIAAFIATISKGAMFALLLRYFSDVSLPDYPRLVIVFIVIAVASMLAGNLLALFQRNIKRLLAYSSIAHFGYILVAFLSVGPLRIEAATYYLVAYFVMTLGAFGVVTLLSSKERDADAIEDYEGLSQRRPWMAGVFTLMLLSLAGMPLTAGFIGKIYLVAAGVRSVLWVPVIALIVGSTIGLAYYLRVIAAMYRSPVPTVSITLSSSLKGEVVMGILFVLLIWWGVYPAQLIRLIRLLKIGP